MAEIIEMSCGSGKALEREFVKKYEEVQLKINMRFRKCFVTIHCSYDCPNSQIDAANDRYGYGIADDMGIKKINCKDCHYNSGRCEDCLFENSKECPEYKEVEDNDSIL